MSQRNDTGCMVKQRKRREDCWRRGRWNEQSEVVLKRIADECWQSRVRAALAGELPIGGVSLSVHPSSCRLLSSGAITHNECTSSPTAAVICVGRLAHWTLITQLSTHSITPPHVISHHMAALPARVGVTAHTPPVQAACVYTNACVDDYRINNSRRIQLPLIL